MNDYEFGDWGRLLLNDLPFAFLLEVLGRTVVMFIVIFTTLRVAGKRGVRQLSVFELVLIIGLGSAAGDPMFYQDVGVLPALVVFGVVIGLYRLLTYLAAKNKKIEVVVEGAPVCLIRDGEFSLGGFEKEDLGQDEFFMELRLANVEHLGQVRQAYLETNGAISVFYYADEEVKPGLPIWPEVFAEKSTRVAKPGDYACTFCGNVAAIAEPTHHHVCERCQRTEWVRALTTTRIS
jgi:uncharacterized membrane protein YcaP (DUF421 family)